MMKNLTKKQLQEVCNQKGIAYTSKMSKEELTNLINNATPKAEKGTSFRGEY